MLGTFSCTRWPFVCHAKPVELQASFLDSRYGKGNREIYHVPLLRLDTLHGAESCVGSLQLNKIILLTLSDSLVLKLVIKFKEWKVWPLHILFGTFHFGFNYS